ncbi:DNA-binding transcriptional LysR family regulator [Pseudorhodobacter sp. 4114]|nr:DNA-binding transcriptional LysR family regulator [Pseudorhodobacter sp. 4114]
MAVAQAENFRRASEVLHVAQPAISRQIAALEEELGVELFIRLPRGVRLSNAGQVMLQRCKSLLGSLDEIIEEVRGVGRGLAGHLKLGFIEVAALSEIMPTSMRTFREKVPDVQLELLSMASMTQIEEIRRRRLDGGFLYNPPIGDPDVEAILLERHPVFLAVPSSSPLALLPSVKLHGLEQERFIWFHRAASPQYHDQLAAAIQTAGVQYNVIHHSESEAVMLALVRMGLGIAFVNARQARRRPDGVTLLPVDDLPVLIDLHFAWRADEISPALGRLITLLSELSGLAPAKQDA